MVAYYNEIDPYAAQWLRNLIAAGHIAPGVVDERDIRDVCPNDLREFTQCHFFAGVGVWSYALRLAQWPDTRAVWTGSCPCQPFSVAGGGAGFGDERHLWPYFHALIEERRPAIILGEQVASRDADPWIDLVQADMEALGYAFGAVPFPSASVGAPHIRDRLYWVADADQGQRRRRSNSERLQSYWQAFGRQQSDGFPKSDCTAYRMGDTSRTGLEGLGCGHQAESGRIAAAGSVAAPGELGGVGNAAGERCGETWRTGTGPEKRFADAGESGGMAYTDMPISEQFAGEWARPSEATGAGAYDQPDGRSELAQGQPATGPTNGFWRAADWLACRDGKWRPVEPGTFPLAHGASARVGRLRAYGNAINAIQAQIFIETVMECL